MNLKAVFATVCVGVLACSTVFSQVPNAIVAPPPELHLSVNAAEALKLAHAGVDDDVLTAFVKASSVPYQLSPEAILYLKEQGISAKVVSVMLDHDTALRNLPPPNTYEQKLYAPTPEHPAEAPSVSLSTPAIPDAPLAPPAPGISDTPSNTPAPPPSPVVEHSPPPTRPETVPPPPGSQYYWQPGYWSWRAGVWVWVSGSWVVRPHPGAMWINGHWSRHERGWVWVTGHWAY